VNYKPWSLFVDRNNTVYVGDLTSHRVYEWREGDVNATRSFSGNFNDLLSLFVTIDGDIYVDNGRNGTVEKLVLNATKSVAVMTVSNHCRWLFVDIANNLYCSLRDEHRVVKQSVNVTAHVTTVVAGTGVIGHTSSTLWFPIGIFVDINFDLYVADCMNHRIQRFVSGQLNGITVAGNNETSSITLSCPVAVFLDYDGYLFILDQGHHRIVRSSSNGFYCVVGCSSAQGTTSHQLYLPAAAAFDNHGNIFVADWDNGRVQKFILMDNDVGKKSDEGISPTDTLCLSSNFANY
jgi:hypothetical protein